MCHLFGVLYTAAASSISLSSDQQRALLVDFACAVHCTTVVNEDLVDVVRDVLPPHLISPEVREQSYYKLTLSLYYCRL